MGAQEFVNRIFRVFQVRQLACPCRTYLSTRGGQPFRDPVITERALFRGVGFRIDEPASIRTCLHAVAATKAVALVYEHDPVRRDESGADGTNLRARRIRTVIA